MLGRKCVKQGQICCTLWLSTLILPRRSLLSKFRRFQCATLNFIVFIPTSKVRPSRHRFSPQKLKSIIYKPHMTHLLPRFSFFTLRASFFSPFLSLFSFFIIHSNYFVIHSFINSFIHCLFVIFPFLFPVIFLFFACISFSLSVFPVVQWRGIWTRESVVQLDPKV
jgi:hypothetical protein